MTAACWVCRGEEMPDNGAQRLGLCPEHLAARVREIMAQRGKPAERLEA